MSDPSDKSSPTRQIQWPRFVIEGVVIVASILMAFGIEAWWEGMQERERASEYIAGLLEDVTENLQELDGTIRRTETEVGAARALRAGTNNQDLDAWRRRADGTEAAEPLLEDSRSLRYGRWSFDGEWILFGTGGRGPSDIIGFRPGVDSAATFRAEIDRIVAEVGG